MSMENSRIPIEELKEGMLIYVSYKRNGWGFFRYPVLKQELIQRITPKKTKIITDRIEHDKYQGFYKINEETDKIAELSRMYDILSDLEFKLRKTNIRNLKDDQIFKLGKMAESITKILEGENT